ncbi:MAG: ATP-binding domain-containing protein [Synechococcales cyanobacterium RU_4_20]|nr:ATP-binding domain-containing protein [Synechococcales cyanobacterium RU_4_20]
MQVRRLRERLGEAPPQARIGTVDKFQGQEAPVVIISLCASTTDDAPRGIEFLLNRNRLNVAVSRAQCLAIVVASPALATATCTSLEQMMQVNLLCKLMNLGDRPRALLRMRHLQTMPPAQILSPCPRLPKSAPLSQCCWRHSIYFAD